MASDIGSSQAHSKRGKRKQGVRGEAPEELEKLHKDRDALQVELLKFKELAARAQADLQNAKGRLERERSEVGTYAVESIIRRLLPTLDNFQRALQHLPPELGNHEWVKGVVAMEQEIMRVLQGAGLRRMVSLGASVDSQCHEVLMTGEGDPGKVLEVFEEGYELSGKVLRPAKVKVGAGEVKEVGQSKIHEDDKDKGSLPKECGERS